MRKHTTPKPLIKRTQLPPAAFRLRCEELARLRGVIGEPSDPGYLSTAFYTPGESTFAIDGELISCVFRVRSSSQADQWHTIGCNIQTDTQRCSCPSGAIGQPCWHAGLARLAAIAAAEIVSADLIQRAVEAAKRADEEMRRAALDPENYCQCSTCQAAAQGWKLSGGR